MLIIKRIVILTIVSCCLANIASASCVSGYWRRPTDSLTFRIMQAKCDGDFTGYIDSPGFSHDVSGTSNSKDEYDMTIDRENKSNHCTTKMYGNITPMSDGSSIWLEITRTDGNCDLPPNYAEPPHKWFRQ